MRSGDRNSLRVSFFVVSESSPVASGSGLRGFPFPCKPDASQPDIQSLCQTERGAAHYRIDFFECLLRVVDTCIMRVTSKKTQQIYSPSVYRHTAYPFLSFQHVCTPLCVKCPHPLSVSMSPKTHPDLPAVPRQSTSLYQISCFHFLYCSKISSFATSVITCEHY
jgi:hypothetical protein